MTPRWLVLAVCTLAHGACGGAAFTNGPDDAGDVDASADGAAAERAADAGRADLEHDQGAGDAGAPRCAPDYGCVSPVCDGPWRPCTAAEALVNVCGPNGGLCCVMRCDGGM